MNGKEKAELGSSAFFMSIPDCLNRVKDLEILN